MILLSKVEFRQGEIFLKKSFWTSCSVFHWISTFLHSIYNSQCQCVCLSPLFNRVEWKLLIKEGMRPYKTAPQCESQNYSTFTPNIESLLRKKISSRCVPKYLWFPFLTKYFFPELTLPFCYFYFTLSHSYTYNTYKFTLKPFHKVVDMVNIFHLPP